MHRLGIETVGKRELDEDAVHRRVVDERTDRRFDLGLCRRRRQVDVARRQTGLGGLGVLAADVPLARTVVADEHGGQTDRRRSGRFDLCPDRRRSARRATRSRPSRSPSRAPTLLLGSFRTRPRANRAVTPADMPSQHRRGLALAAAARTSADVGAERSHVPRPACRRIDCGIDAVAVGEFDHGSPTRSSTASVIASVRSSLTCCPRTAPSTVRAISQRCRR